MNELDKSLVGDWGSVNKVQGPELIPRIHVCLSFLFVCLFFKAGMVSYVYNPGTGEVERQIPGAHWPVSQAYLAREILSQNSKIDNARETIPQAIL